MKARIFAIVLVVASLANCAKKTASSTDPGSPGSGIVVADAEADFKATQSPSTVVSISGKDAARGTWTFGMTPAAEPYDPNAFVAFDTRHYNVATFETYGFIHRASSLTPWVGQDCGNPDQGFAIRRWTSLFTGTVVLTGTVGMDITHQANPPGGTGTRVRLFVDGVQKYTKDLAGNDATQFPFTVSGDIPIVPGTKIDCVISQIDPSSAIANFVMTVTTK